MTSLEFQLRSQIRVFQNERALRNGAPSSASVPDCTCSRRTLPERNWSLTLEGSNRVKLSKIRCFSELEAQPAFRAVRKEEGRASVSCSTFNILAPIYKRTPGDDRGRESDCRDSWRRRNDGILQMLLDKKSDLICLQEFWVENDELASMYMNALSAENYQVHLLPRTNARGDGLLMAVKRDAFEVQDYQPVLFNDCGDRVAQVARIVSRATPNCAAVDNDKTAAVDMLVINTHLLFPHNANSSLIRLREVYKILEYLEKYKIENRLPSVPILLCGDCNGTKRGQVYKFLRSQGFVSSYDRAMQYPDSKLQWISHLNHHGVLCGVDYIWLLNSTNQREPLTADWKAAVFGMIKAKLNDAGFLKDREAFDFFNAQGIGSSTAASSLPGELKVRNMKKKDAFSLDDFRYAMDKLGLTGEHSVGLTMSEMEELVQSVDLDGNGMIDYEEFERIFQMSSMEETYSRIRKSTGITEMSWEPTPANLGDVQLRQSEYEISIRGSQCGDSTASGMGISFNKVNKNTNNSFRMDVDVCSAELFPPEMDRGVWPNDYKLSDHACLTAVFAPSQITTSNSALGGTDLSVV